MEITTEIISIAGTAFATIVWGYTHLLMKFQKLFLDVELVKTKQKITEDSVKDHDLGLATIQADLSNIKNTMQRIEDYLLNNKKN